MLITDCTNKKKTRLVKFDSVGEQVVGCVPSEMSDDVPGPVPVLHHSAPPAGLLPAPGPVWPHQEAADHQDNKPGSQLSQEVCL